MYTIVGTSIAAAAVMGVGVGVYAWNNATFASRYYDAVTKAGYIEHTYQLENGKCLNYAEGPINGPALLLIHGQGAAWESYAPVLPKLAKNFHVFAVDVAGHGASSWNSDRYNVLNIGNDIATIIKNVIDQPVILSGHSSGGLIAAWIAANKPELVSAVLFEDPPFFSTEPERMPRQFNYIDLATPAHDFLRQDAETDFASWYVEHNAWIRYFKNGRKGIARYASNYRKKHPNDPLNIWFLPPSVNKSFQFMHEFDPAFADAFFTFEWQHDFDQQATLEAIDVPTILVHANWRITEAGILEGAMTDADAARAYNGLSHCQMERVDTGHGFHDEDPDLFVRLIDTLRIEAVSND